MPRLLMLLIVTLGVLSMALTASEIKDSESASHAADAAKIMVVETYDFSTVRVVQFDLSVLSHYSYLVIVGKDCLVVDPARDVQAYLDYAKQEGLTIKGVLLTHSHADFVAGHSELAKAVGCSIWQSHRSGAGYAFKAVKDGDRIPLGTAVIGTLETPGHTPDGVTWAIHPSAEAAPVALLTGDTLFVGSVGRPDLMGGTMSAQELATMMWHSWHDQLAPLDDAVVVLPAHGAGSLCGAHLSADPSSTIGRERRSNAYLQYTSQADFITAVLDGLPEAPQYFGHNAKMNKDGPPLVDWVAQPAAITPAAALEDPAQVAVIDIRDAADYAKGHVPRSLNIHVRGRLETWTGIMVPWGSKVVLVGEAKDLAESAHRLHRIGYTVSGVVSWTTWAASDREAWTNQPIEPQELYAQQQAGTAPIVVDVRLPTEWMGLRIGNVLNLPLNHLGELSSKLDKTKPVVAVCNSAFRSSLAVGVLEQQGFRQARSMRGGSQAWIDAGLPVIKPTQGGGAAPSTRFVHLAERLAPVTLKAMLMDAPGSFELVDIRPPEQFADYALPGARNVAIADLLEDRAALVGDLPLVIVDRDGSLAMMVAGILSQKTKRSIKALHGGMRAYWEEDGPRGGGSLPAPGAPTARPAPMVPAPAQPAPAAPAKPKRPSAGC